MCVDDTISATQLHCSIHPQWILWDMGSTDFVSFSYSCLSFFSLLLLYCLIFNGTMSQFFRPRGTVYSSFWHFSLILIQMDFKFRGLFPWIYQVLVPTYLIYSSPRNYAGRAEVRTWMIPPANDLVALPSFLVICNRKFFEPAKEGQRPHRSRDYLTTKAKSFACLPTYHRGPPSNSRSKFWQRLPCSDICCWLEACLSLEVDWF